MKKELIISVFACMLILLYSGCYFDNAENLYPDLPGDCDPTQVAYQTNIKPIIQQTCYTCHNSANATALGSGIDLENTTTLGQYVNNGAFLGSIEHSPGYVPMPDGGGKLTDCQIETIKNWINDGASTN